MARYDGPTRWQSAPGWRGRQDVGASAAPDGRYAARLADRLQDLAGLGPGGVVRVDVDPADHAVGIGDEDSRHRQPGGPVGVNLGQVQADLQEWSILKRQLKEDSLPLYWLLDTLRQYGQARLRELGKRATTQKRHFEWICALVKLTGGWDAQQAESFKRMSGEQDNMWAALEYCADQPGEIEATAELAQDLFVYWTARRPYGDVRRRLTSLAERAPETRLLARACSWFRPQWLPARTTTTAALGEESFRIATEVRDVEAAAWSLVSRAMPCRMQEIPRQPPSLPNRPCRWPG
jgi:hypothetical protein